MDLTNRQQQILQFIRDFLHEHGYPPTRADIVRAQGFRSPNAAETHLRALARKGAIELRRGTSRGIRLTEEEPDLPASFTIPSATVPGQSGTGASPVPGVAAPDDPVGEDGGVPDDPGLPVIGRVAAGSPLLAEESIEARRNLESSLFSPSADYLLRVRGDSMRDAGILDGDLLAVHRTRRVRNGQIAVVRLQDEVTVKFLEHDGTVLRLIPANPDFAIREIDPDRDLAEIEGLGVGVLRDRMPNSLPFPGGRA